MLASLGGVLTQLAGYGHLAGDLLLTPAGLMTLAAAALAGVLADFLTRRARIAATATAVPLTSRAAALRASSRRVAFLRQRDPDAAGRARPRAPSAGPAAV